MGLVVAMLCVTGVAIWARKRAGRRAAAGMRQARSTPAVERGA